MSNYIRTYSPEKVYISWGGYNFTGFADGTFVTMQRAAPRTETIVGAHGDSGITKSSNFTGTVEVVLLQNSVTNQGLSGVVNTEDLTGELFRADMQVRDASGSTIVEARRCHIQTGADVMLGDAQNNKTWVFYSEDIRYLELPKGLDAAAGLSNVASIVQNVKSISDQFATITS